MKTERMLILLLTAIVGCTRAPQSTALIPTEQTTTAQPHAHKASIPDEEKFIVIGQVIGTQRERVAHILEQAGIRCMVHGDEFHEIIVPKQNKQDAINVVAKDARENGYEISWNTE